jgi:hypothetical protein
MVIESFGDRPNERVLSLLDRNLDVGRNTDPPHVNNSIIEIVQACFTGLADPVQSHATRRLMLQNYQIATKLLRSALAVDSTDRALAAPIRALALYEVCCELTLQITFRD